MKKTLVKCTKSLGILAVLAVAACGLVSAEEAGNLEAEFRDRGPTIEREMEDVANGDRRISAGRQEREDGDKEFCDRPGDFRRGEMAGWKGRGVANGDRRASAGRQEREDGERKIEGDATGTRRPECRAKDKSRRGRWNAESSGDGSETNVK